MSVDKLGLTWCAAVDEANRTGAAGLALALIEMFRKLGSALLCLL